jgi:hypothetical protein
MYESYESLFDPLVKIEKKTPNTVEENSMEGKVSGTLIAAIGTIYLITAIKGGIQEALKRRKAKKGLKDDPDAEIITNDITNFIDYILKTTKKVINDAHKKWNKPEYELDLPLGSSDGYFDDINRIIKKIVEAYYTKETGYITLLEIFYNTDCADICGDIEYEIANMFCDAFKTHGYEFTYKGKKLTFKCEISERDVNDGEIVLCIDVV